MFDSVNHSFLVAVLKTFGFGKYFLHWIEILLTNQESCVLNDTTIAKYFKLKRATRQGDPISAYLFIESAKMCALHTHVATCLAFLCAHVPTCLAWLSAHMLTCLDAYMLTCQRVLHAYLLKC